MCMLMNFLYITNRFPYKFMHLVYNNMYESKEVAVKMLLRAIMWGLLLSKPTIHCMDQNCINKYPWMDKLPSDTAITANITFFSPQSLATFLGRYFWDERFQYTIESLQIFWQALQKKHSPEVLNGILRMTCQEEGGDGYYISCQRYAIAALVHAGANPEINSTGYTCLGQAVLQEDTSAVRFLL